MSLYTISNNDLSVTISDRGAEMQSIVDRDGNERLWQGDPAWWTGRAPILFPVCGALKDDRYTLDGKTYILQKHGFARESSWTAEKINGDSAVFLLTRQVPGFPFRYELRARFALDGPSIRITFEARNLDDRVFCYGIGSHEAYAAPNGLGQCRLLFDESETFENSELDSNLLQHKTSLLRENTHEFPLTWDYFKLRDSLIFLSLRSRGVTLVDDSTGLRASVSYPGMDVFLIWTKPGANYICLEPWTNAPDFVDADPDITRKPGFIRLEPGGTATRTHTITFS